jgi:hypothetical protein
VPVGVLLNAGTKGFAENRAVIDDQDFSHAITALRVSLVGAGRWGAVSDERGP